MDNTFLGIPLFIWSGVALVLAAIYTLVWPRPAPGQTRPRWMQIVLRWFHALVWILLAAAAFMLGVGNALGNQIALVALACYAVFLITFVLDRTRRTR